MKNEKTRKTEKQSPDNAENASIKEIKPQRQKKKRYILLYLAIIGFAFYAVITIVNQNVRIAQKKARLEELNKQINIVEIETGYLEKVRNYEGEDLEEYIEKIAKEDLGYISEGERIFINVAGE